MHSPERLNPFLEPGMVDHDRERRHFPQIPERQDYGFLRCFRRTGTSTGACFRHLDRISVVKDHTKQFDVDCPDGGCQEPWSVFLPMYFATAEHLTLIESHLVERS